MRHILLLTGDLDVIFECYHRTISVANNQEVVLMNVTKLNWITITNIIVIIIIITLIIFCTSIFF